MNSRLGVFSIAFATAILTTTAASAHTGTGLGAGFLHPLSGLDHLETAIFASVTILIMLASIATRLNAVLAAAVTGGFALFHGAAHGMELAVATPVSFIAGFLAASVVVMAAGAAAGAAIERIRLSLVATD
jgi:urease accessory protein